MIILKSKNTGLKKAIIEFTDIENVFKEIENAHEFIFGEEIILKDGVADLILKRLGYNTSEYQYMFKTQEFNILNPETGIKEHFSLYLSSQAIDMNKTRYEINNQITNNFQNNFTKKPEILLFQITYKGNNFIIEDGELLTDINCCQLIKNSLNKLQNSFQNKINNRIKNKNF